MWENTINGKRYIGSSIDLRERIYLYFNNNHLLSNTSMYICRALLKHGYSKFSLTILEYCSPDKCIEREDYYLCSLPHEYNIAQKAGAPMYGRKHSEETIKILSETNTGEKNPMYGKNHSEETKTIMSDAKKGNTNGFKKGQAKLEGSGNPSQAIEVVDIINNITTYYISMHEAARVLNIPHFNVIRNYILRNQKKPYKGKYTFKKL